MKIIRNRQILLNIVLFILLPFIITVVIESLGNRSPFGGIIKLVKDPYIFFCNLLIIAFTISPGMLLVKLRYLWIFIVSACWIMLGVVNYILICNRILPLTAYDLQLIDSIPHIVKRYLSPVPLAITCLSVIAVLLGIFTFLFRAFSAPKKKCRLKLSIVYFVVLMLLTNINLKYAVSSGTLEKRFRELRKSYVDNGFAYSFLVSIIDKGVDKVDGYSESLIDSITKNFAVNKCEKIKTPNIILVQMESFFDLNALKSIRFSDNPVHNFTKLMAENPSGLLTVPVVGAGTANTEFEVVTGMNVSDFGAGEYPYKTVLLNNTCESIAYNLKNYGYTSHFIHNYKGSFYGRNIVYANLGYDYFYSLEYMTDYETNENGWAKDEVLLRYIIESLDSTEGQDLVTAVSVQGHGGYDNNRDYIKHITVTDCPNNSLRFSYEYYANQIYEMDQFLGNLVEKISQRGEETILVIYGDHFPSIDITNIDLIDRTIYQTDYVIWNNIGIEYSEEDLNAYQISSKILESINITDGVINSCHQNYKNDVSYLYNLQALEYDILYGKKYVYNRSNPYKTSKMKKNCRKIMIYDITKSVDKDNSYIIFGEGFSDKSFVRVGYKIVPTEYVNQNTLRFSASGIENNTPISVWEMDIGDTGKYFIN